MSTNMKAPADEVFEALHDVVHLYKARRQRAIASSGQPVSQMEAKAVGFFGRRPGATLSDFALHSGRDKSQLARVISGLRERGLMEAREDEGDRRNIRLQLTPLGDAIHAELRQALRKVAREAAGGLSEAERDKLLELLRKVGERVAAERPD
jgi:DNA-binding MarR family transcriptional regulator